MRENEHQISLFKNEELIKDKILLVPTYKKAVTQYLLMIKTVKFEISEEDFEVLKSFASQALDDRVLIDEI